jgi:hypothetical protein
MPSLTNSACTAATLTTMPFQTYINTCLTADEQSQANNIISGNKITEMFTYQQAIQTDLLTSLNGVKALNNSGLKVVPSIELNKLNTRLADIRKEIKDNETQIEVQNQKFLQSITSAPKSSYLLANYQDVTLMFFFGSLILFTIVITIIQFTKKDGSVKGAVAVFLAMFFTIIVTYGLLKEVA